jgi:hypothetical protein
MIEDFDLSQAGETLKGSQYVKSAPRKWTDTELTWALAKRDEGGSIAEIATALERTEVSVFVKLKRHSKNNDTYNVKFREMKYQANATFAALVEPKSVLDLYAGNSWWKESGYDTVSNDIDERYENDFHLSALDLMCQLHLEKKKFDVIDLDPFGSAYECFDLAFGAAKKGIVISFGEWGHKRWKRVDYVAPRYGIHSIDDFSHEPFIVEAQRIARLHKKVADVVDVLQYSNFLRVYFTLTDYKETSQWDK